MNFKKMAKRFFTLSQNHDGFTLVELIVVIAIMAILAGVAVPAYTGYINKANKASDLQLLGAINTAFGAAVLENGGNARQLQSASATIVNGKLISVSAGGLDIQASFDKYYGANADATFKVITGLTFNRTEGVFEEGEGGMTGEAMQEAVNNWNKGNSVGKEESLAESVENLSNALGNRLSPDEDGIDLLKAYMGEDYDTFLADYGFSEDDYDPSEVANAAVMYVADKMQGVTSSDIAGLLQGDVANMGAVADKYGQIPTAALMYGVVTGYANSGNASKEFMEAYSKAPTGINDVNALVTAMGNDANFESYLTAPEKGAMADMDAYLAAMSVVNNYQGSFDLTDPDLFTSDSTIGLLEAVLGSSANSNG